MSVFRTANWTALPAEARTTAGTVRHGMPMAFLLCVCVVLLPNIGAVPGLSLYDSKRILQVSLLLINGVWLLSVFKLADGAFTTYSALSTAARLLLAAVVALGCWSAVLAPLPLYGFLEIFHLVLLGALVITVAHSYRSTRLISDNLIVGVVTISALLYAVSAGVGYAMSLVSPGIRVWPAAFIGFEHIRFFNQFQTWTLPLLVLAPLFFARGVRYRIKLLLVPAAVWWMLLFASGGRGTLVAMIASAAVVLFAFRRDALSWMKLQGMTAMIGAIFYGLLFKVAATTEKSLLDRDVTTDMGRFWYWREAVERISENWLFGIGPMHHAGFTVESWSHPHNSVLQLALEWGVPAALLLIAVVCWAFWSWIRQSRDVLENDTSQVSGQVRIALTASLAGAAVHSLFSGIIVMPMSQMMMVLVLGWALGMYIKYRMGDPPYTSPSPVLRKRVPFAAIVGLALVVLATTAVPDCLRRAESEAHYVETVNPKLFHPRYWRQGAFRY